MKRSFIFTALATFAAAGALAQDVTGEPYNGAHKLEAGFQPDPFVLDVTSGGNIDISKRMAECSGYISDRPDVRVFFGAGNLPLIFSVDAPSDTTLVINAPDGAWHCDDDSGAGLNPSVRFAVPQSGRYEIWIGTYSDSEQFNDARLSISELTSE